MASFDAGRAPSRERLNQTIRTLGVSDWSESDTLDTDPRSKAQHLMTQDPRTEQLDDARIQHSSMRRPRAGTMPAQTTIYPHVPDQDVHETERLNVAGSAAVPTVTSQRSRSGSSAMPHPLPSALGDSAFDIWGPEPGMQSPTTPTTDQLLKEDKGNTIASTLASLGLDDERDRQPVLHTRHSYTSLNTLDRCSDWLRPHRPEASEHPWRRVTPDTMPYLPMQPSTASTSASDTSTFTANDNFLPVPNLVTNKLQLPPAGRPRAISMTVADNRHAPLASQSSAAAAQSHGCLPTPYYSIWNPSTSMRRQPFHERDQSRPSLRTSNSSADLLEMIARQKRTATSLSPLPVYATLPEERGVSPFNISSSSLEAPSYNGLESENMVGSSKGSPASIPAQVPTRSLWLGNIDPSLSNADLNEIFRRYGPIENVRVLPDRECAFVNFINLEDALRAKDALIHQMGCKLGSTLVKVGFGKPDSVPHQTMGDFGNAQEPTRALWIGNIPSTTTTTTLYTIFSPYGPIESVRVLTHKNCGFVNFETLEDAQHARRSLHGKDIIGAGTGPLRIGFAKVPSKTGNISTMDTHDDTDLDLTKGWTPSSQKEDYQTQMLMYMMAEMMGDASANIFTAVAAERKQIMEELGEDDSDGPLFDQMHIPLTYYSQIPAAPELGQNRKVDISRLRDIRKRLDTGAYVATTELETIAIECLDEIVELCSDYIGNTVIQRLFERCSEATKTKMTQVVAPHLASIGIHKNGTWAAQKIIETAKLPANIDLLCSSIKLYVPALLLDQFGNYVVQCCLSLGPERNQFIFDAIVDNCWEIAKGRFGARAVRATLESPHVTKRQQKYVAATIVQHALMLATNTNGALLLIWLLDTSGIPGRYRVLALRLCPHLARLCTHKLASLTVLKIVNQRQEPDARKLIIDTLVFSPSDDIINEVLMDQVHGVNLIQKILSSSYVELSERQRIAERIKQLLHKLRLQHVQGYKRLLEEINMVMGDSNPGASLGALPGIVPPSFAMNPDFAAALQAKYFAAAAAAAAVGSKSSAQSMHQPSNLPAYFNLPTTVGSTSSPSTPDAQPKSSE